MKHPGKIVMLLALVIGGIHATAQNDKYNAKRTLVLTNNTADDMVYCYAYYDMNLQIWTSVGWTRIAAYSTSSIRVGVATTPKFFVHAENNRGDVWGIDDEFSVYSKYEFRIPNADKNECGERAKFFPVMLNDVGVTEFTFTQQ